MDTKRTDTAREGNGAVARIEMRVTGYLLEMDRLIDTTRAAILAGDYPSAEAATERLTAINDEAMQLLRMAMMQ